MLELIPPRAASAQPVNPLAEPHWNESLPPGPERSFFHLAEWARVLQESYSVVPCYLTVRVGGRVQQCLPLMEVDSWVTGRRGVSLPFSDFCAPLLPEPGCFAPLLEQAVEYGAGRGWKYLELRGGARLMSSARTSHSFYGHQLCLAAGEPELAGALHPSVRRAIRKAQKLGVKVQLLKDEPGLREFYRLQCRTRRRHGLPPQPWRFFLKLQEHILARDKGLLVLARYGDSPVAGALFLHWDKQVLFKYGASHEDHQNLRANDLVMWEAIQYYARRGFERLDLGRTSQANAGLRRFKLAWGAQEHVLEYLRYDIRGREFVTAKDEAFGWHNRLFRRLPLGLSRWLGSLAYRHAA